MDKVSVIIPSYNRFQFLIKAIKSVTKQTYQNIEVIVVNDCSTQSDYYSFDFKTLGENIYVVNLPRRSRDIFGNVCGGGNSRNIGMMLSSGSYIAFLDDDDYFLPTKIEKQLEQMKKNNCQMSCTEALAGVGTYNHQLTYQSWHYKGKFWSNLHIIFSRKNKLELLKKMYQYDNNVWGQEEISTWNCTCGGSSMIIKKDLIPKAGYFPLRDFAEDWYYWKELIKYSKCLFIREPLVYIDLGHGDGQNY